MQESRNNCAERTATANQRKAASFSAFFHTRLKPALERFERVRRWRFPVLAGIGLAIAMVGGLIFYAFLPALGALWFVVAGGIFICMPGLAMSQLMRSVSHPASNFKIANEMLNFIVPLWLVDMAASIMRSFDHLLFDNRRRRNDFSFEIVRPTVDFAAPNLISHPHEYIGQGDFIESGLFGYAITRYGGRDYFHGRRDQYKISFSWLFAENRIGREKDKREEVFKGWFFVADFPRVFDGDTLVLPDRAEAAMGWFGRSLQSMATPRDMRLIQLEDPDFEQRFKVLSTDDIGARSILSPHIMHTASALHRSLAGGLVLSFSSNRMYAAVPAVMEYFGLFPARPFTHPAFTRHLYQAVKGVNALAGEIAKHQFVWRIEKKESPALDTGLRLTK